MLVFAFSKVPGEHAIELAFDEVYSDAIRNEVVTREAVPFFSVTKSQIKSLDRAKVDAGHFICMGIGWDGWKKASDVQEPGEFFRFEEERDGHRGVVVRPQGKYARDRYHRSRNDHGQREGTEDGGLRGLSI